MLVDILTFEFEIEALELGFDLAIGDVRDSGRVFPLVISVVLKDWAAK